MAKMVICAICLTRGETVAMQLVNSFFRCPECGAETYDNADGDDSFVRKWQQQQMHISRSFQPGTHISGGGEGTGKPKVEAMKKKSLGALKFGMDEKRVYF